MIKTSVKCDAWCKHQINGICTQEILNIEWDETGKLKLSCLEFDVKKAACGLCTNWNMDGGKDFCDVDQVEIKEAESTCWNGRFEFGN